MRTLGKPYRLFPIAKNSLGFLGLFERKKGFSFMATKALTMAFEVASGFVHRKN